MVFFMMLFVLCAVWGYFAHADRTVALKLPKGKTVHVTANELYLAGSLLILGLICGLRHVDIGVDTDVYVSTFMIPDALNSTVNGATKYEIGYVLFVKFIRLFSAQYPVFLLAISVVVFGGLYLFIRNNCAENYPVALLVYMAFLYYINFSAVRQAMALAIAINSVQYLRKKKWIPAVLVILLAATFQKTVLLVLVMVPFALDFNDRWKILISAGLCCLGLILFEPLVMIVIRIFPAYARYWGSEMMDGPGGIGIFAMLVSLLTLFAAWMVLRNKVKFENAEQRRTYVLALVGCIFTVAINLLGRRYGIFSRMTRFFIPFVMIMACQVYHFCIPDVLVDVQYLDGLLKQLKLKKLSLAKYADAENHPKIAALKIPMKQLYYLLVVGLMGIYFFTIMRTDLYCLIPYRFFFN